MKTALITGANRGLGFALVRKMCKSFDPSQWRIYLTARNLERGSRAMEKLAAEGLHPSFHLLDVAHNESVSACANYMVNTHGAVDLVISNAAHPITPDLSQAEQVDDFINTNNHGTYRMIKSFGPLLADGARFVVVASGFGTLGSLPAAARAKFCTSQMTLEDVENQMDAYSNAVKAGTSASEWGDWINIPSKVGQVAAMRVFAREMRMKAEKRNILINAVCPGLMDTESSRPWFKDMSSAKQPEEAVDDVLWIATLVNDAREPYGELVQYRKVLPFE